MTRKELLRDYWSHYIHLENKFIQTLNYVELNAAHVDVFSNEYASLLQLIGGELDSFFKTYCGFSPEERKNISDYATYILSDYPDILTQEIRVYDIILKPFENWNTANAATSLTWWTAYNNIKHSRVFNKTEASQSNVLNALAALYLLEMKQLSKITAGTHELDFPDKESTLFSLQGWSFKFASARDLAIPLEGAISAPVEE